MMLNPRGIRVADEPRPLWPFGLHQHDRLARTVEPFIAAGFSDDEAWEALFDDDHRLATFRSVYGNRKGRSRR